MIKNALNWLVGVETPPLTGTWDGHSMLLGWRLLQQHEQARPHTSLNWLIALVSLTFLIPLFAWSATPQLPMVQVPVLKERVLGGHVLTESDFVFKEMQQRYVSERHLQRIEDAVGLEAIRPQRPGVPLYLSHLQDVPAVRQNALVTLKFEMPGLSLTGSGKALESGQVGDLVQVKNIGSKKVIAGVIVAENIVDVQHQ